MSYGDDFLSAFSSLGLGALNGTSNMPASLSRADDTVFEPFPAKETIATNTPDTTTVGALTRKQTLLTSSGIQQGHIPLHAPLRFPAFVIQRQQLQQPQRYLPVPAHDQAKAY